MDAHGPRREADPARRPVSVFEIDGTPDPASCGDLPDLSPAELDGDSVNEDPTANQPAHWHSYDACSPSTPAPC